MRVHPTQANKRNNTHTCLIPSQVESIEGEEEAEALDSHGIPGWDKWTNCSLTFVGCR